ncbi:MAG: glycosyltransferase family 39 protein [Solirubrobacterales bacterium]|nr:glycosyltransferase family 39 protein [Solirubrobacterales bacterium]
MSAPQTKTQRVEVMWLIGLCVVAAAVRFIGLGSQSFWLDETFTWKITGGSVSHVFSGVRDLESTPPLAYLLVWLSRQALGSSEFALRFFPALAGTLTVPAVWLGGRRLFGPRAGLFAAALTAVSPFMWWYSQDARAYSLAALMCALILAAFAYRMTGGGGLSLVAWGAASVGALVTQYSALAVVLATLGALLVFDRDRWKQVVGAALAPLIACAALLNLATTQAGHGMTDWIAGIPFGERAAQVFSQAWAGTAIGRFGAPLYLCAGVAIALIALLVVVGRRSVGESGRDLRRLGWTLLASFVLLTAILLLDGDRLLARYYIVIWPLAVIAAAGVAATVRPRTGLVAVAIACGAMAGLVARIDATPDLQGLDWRPIAKALGPSPLHGRLVVLQEYPYWQALSPYLPDLVPFGPKSGQYPVSVEVVTIMAGEPQSCWWCSARGVVGVAPSAKAVGFFPFASTIGAGRFLITSYRSSNPFLAERQRIPITGGVVAASLTPSLGSGAVLFQPWPGDPYITALLKRRK